MTPLRLRILHVLRLQPMTCAFLARCLGYATRPEQRIVWASLERLGMQGMIRRKGRVYSLRFDSVRQAEIVRRVLTFNEE